MLNQVCAEGLHTRGVGDVYKGHLILGMEVDGKRLKQIGKVDHMACRAVEGIALRACQRGDVGDQRAAQRVTGQRDVSGVFIGAIGLQRGVELSAIELVEQGKAHIDAPIRVGGEHRSRAALGAAIGDDDVVPLAEDVRGIAGLAVDHVGNDPVPEHLIDLNPVHGGLLEDGLGHFLFIVSRFVLGNVQIGLLLQPLGHGVSAVLEGGRDSGVCHIGENQVDDLVRQRRLRFLPLADETDDLRREASGRIPGNPGVIPVCTVPVGLLLGEHVHVVAGAVRLSDVPVGVNHRLAGNPFPRPAEPICAQPVGVLPAEGDQRADSVLLLLRGDGGEVSAKLLAVVSGFSPRHCELISHVTVTLKRNRFVRNLGCLRSKGNRREHGDEQYAG